MIKAPYNFVPLSDKVVFPDEWSSRISQDIPFSDGISGKISIQLTAETPIFIRNGHTKQDAESKNSEYASFSHISDGKATRYFLPGTSVKGAIRNVLEIMTFGKMRVDPNLRFAQRDWENKHLYNIKTPEAQNNMYCGWLRPKNDGSDDYEIIDCGKPKRIAQPEIDYYLDLKTPIFESHFSLPTVTNRYLNTKQKINGKEFDPKTAAFKYQLIEKYASLKDLRNLRFSEINTPEDSDYATKGVFVSDDGFEGTIVLTGQPNLWDSRNLKERQPNAGKLFEFVFKSPNKNSRVYDVSEEEFAQYKTMYADSDDWKYANKKFLNSTGIPVFFRKENNKIIDWGLAFLYKLPYQHTPYETLATDHKTDKPDIAECIFGYSNKNSSLKGRVQFTHFWSDNANPVQEDISLVLNGPKASYYPIYISQEGHDGILDGKYKTLNDGRLKGWKRYLLRKETWQKNTGSSQLDTILHPLKEGSKFRGEIMFHNLKPEELGALLSALTFHGNEKRAYHQIGMAKPYGFGKVKLEVTGLKIFSVGKKDPTFNTDPESYLKIFEKYMTGKLGNSWINTPVISEMLTLATHTVTDNTTSNYMLLEMKGQNEFLQAKGGRGMKNTRYYLPYLSEILKSSKGEMKNNEQPFKPKKYHKPNK